MRAPALALAGFMLGVGAGLLPPGDSRASAGFETGVRWTADAMAGARYRLLREALAQAEKITPDWHPDQRDCAGFVRYLWR